ncbi:hypothetical protein LA52FAK_16120 [Desulforhopalus sp. 52FAK]
MQVSQDFDNSYDFKIANTYNWDKELQSSTDDLLKEDELLAKRFFSAIELNLQNQGMNLSDTPDILVSCTYTITTRIQSETVQPTIGVGYGRYGRYGGFGVQSGSSVRQYDRGLLTINMHNAKDGRLIWKGNATREVFTHSSPERLTKSVNEMVQATLAQFPPVH